MAKQTVTKEQIECSIDLMLMMIVEELQETLSMSAPEILESFLLSKTGQSLYDPDTKFWCFGPSYIVDLFLDEIKLPSI